MATECNGVTTRNPILIARTLGWLSMMISSLTGITQRGYELDLHRRSLVSLLTHGVLLPTFHALIVNNVASISFRVMLKGDAKAQALKAAKAVKTGSTFKKKAKKIRTKFPRSELLKAEVPLVADGDVVLDGDVVGYGQRRGRGGGSTSMLIGFPVDGQSSENVVKGMSDCES
ncbi:hypothetical protein L2E82_38918 [Cichorium intybus]|uniref:Uncharacterized protein n=1 Tax=Cichorium intybus TaxID=13427 RepID=A0ACB9AGK3_CICIN|nr:hypothetical protein L2E82_38918 [Cichorium intybus]